jgi:xylulose-5-phosphate/fructose-6-phosphate phosphoketolase
VDRVRNVTAHVRQWLKNKLMEHQQYIMEVGEDMPEVRDWRWGG